MSLTIAHFAFRARRLTLVCAVAVFTTSPALAQDAAPAAGPPQATAPSLADQLAASTERLPLSGRMGPNLFRPGFAVGEYSGSSNSVTSHAFIGFRSDSASANFDVKLPSTDQPVTGQCKGGQGELSLAPFVDIARHGLTYVCTLGGGAPAGAELDLVEATGGGFLNSMAQAQRAGAFVYGDIHLRARTQLISGIPFVGGRTVSYAITRDDGTLVGGYQVGGLGQPIFYLPKTLGPERDAVAVLAVALYAFRDPGGMW